MQTLFHVQSRRFAWAYVLWLLIGYLPIAAGCTLADPTDRIIHPKWLLIWVLLVPVAVALVQMVCPTLLGWFLLFVPTLIYAVASMYRTLHYPSVAQHWAPYDTGDFGLAFFFSAAIGLSAAILLLIRPDFHLQTPAPNNALQRTGIGGGASSDLHA